MLKIKELRNARGLTQKELAKNCGISDKSIWAYENQIATPPLDVLKLLADFFECSIDYLTGREDDFGNIVLPTAAPNLSQQEQGIIVAFRSLPKDLQQRAAAYISRLGELANDEKAATVTKKDIV